MMKGKDKEKVKLKIKKSSWQKCLSSGSTHELGKKWKYTPVHAPYKLKAREKKEDTGGKNPK